MCPLWTWFNKGCKVKCNSIFYCRLLKKQNNLMFSWCIYIYLEFFFMLFPIFFFWIRFFKIVITILCITIISATIVTWNFLMAPPLIAQLHWCVHDTMLNQRQFNRSQADLDSSLRQLLELESNDFFAVETMVGFTLPERLPHCLIAGP